jgi:hypothetical protein
MPPARHGSAGRGHCALLRPFYQGCVVANIHSEPLPASQRPRGCHQGPISAWCPWKGSSAASGTAFRTSLVMASLISIQLPGARPLVAPVGLCRQASAAGLGSGVVGGPGGGPLALPEGSRIAKHYGISANMPWRAVRRREKAPYHHQVCLTAPPPCPPPVACRTPDLRPFFTSHTSSHARPEVPHRLQRVRPGHGR